MATKIRLKRIGRRNRPFYRLVAIDSRKRRDGAAIEELGWYNPIDLEHSFDLKSDRILHWLSEGAQPTEAAKKLLRSSGLNYRWHLIRQGMDEKEVAIEMKKWELNREEVLKIRDEKAEEKLAKKQRDSKLKDDTNSSDKPISEIEDLGSKSTESSSEEE